MGELPSQIGALRRQVADRLWVLLLPIMVGLWIWQSSLPALVSLVAVAGIVTWTLLAVSSFLRAAR